jgi:hypothetical protein
VQANIWKWLKKGGRRFARMKATRQFVKRNNNSATKMATTTRTDCPHRALLQQFLDRSLDLEREILGDVGVGDKDNSSAAAQHTQAFWNHSRKQAFCSVNVTEVLLQDPNTWKDFYQSLP